MPSERGRFYCTDPAVPARPTPPAGIDFLPLPAVTLRRIVFLHLASSSGSGYC